MAGGGNDGNSECDQCGQHLDQRARQIENGGAAEFFVHWSWPATLPDGVLEPSMTLDSTDHWTTVPNLPVLSPEGSILQLRIAADDQFFRFRQAS